MTTNSLIVDGPHAGREVERLASKIINFALENDQIKHMGVKFYCFDR